MATLVLTTVGTALGGPLGGMLGGLIGQSVDQGLFGDRRRGPRLGDLAVQASSYGSQVPRIYGRMRVAGTVIWSTDLVEREVVEGGGKSSPERLGYSYSVSLAVALSSRPITSVKRIWADGKLIRGASGEFHVETGFRVATGDEDQPADPLIASIEAVARTPAYRGLALAIFEELQLAEFGNRIPMLTFEVEADPEPLTLSELLSDASEGMIEVSDPRPIIGYAAYGSSVAESMRPLVELRGLDLFERQGKLRSPSEAVPTIQLAEEELGCDADGNPRPRIEFSRTPDRDLPASQLLAYHDPDRDYLTGQMRASSGGGGRGEQRTELPAVLSAGQAKLWVEEGLARRWQSANSVQLRLPPSQMSLSPGRSIQLAGVNGPLTVRTMTIDGMTVAVEAGPSAVSVAPLPADPGRPVSDADIPVGRSELALFELPSMSDAPQPVARLFLAASNAGRWKPLTVELGSGREALPPISVSRRAVLGMATTVLPNRAPHIVDELSAVTVRLVNPDQLLLNADGDALMAGANSAMLGCEMIQFGRAEQLERGLFRLSMLLRGRRGTEWATAAHSAGESFCLLDGQAMVTVDRPPSVVGSVLTATANGIGDRPPLPERQWRVSGEALRPPSVCHLQVRREGEEIHASWVRRSCRSWAWNDGIGDPPDPFPERYRVVVTGPSGELSVETEVPRVSIPVASLPATSGEPVQFAAHQLGPMAISHARIANFIA